MFHFKIQKLRMQSGLVRQVQVQFLWYGTRSGYNQDKSGAYLFLPGEEGGQVKPGQGLRTEPEPQMSFIYVFVVNISAALFIF